MEYARSPVLGGTSGGGGGSELMDFSLIDDGFSSPRYAPTAAPLSGRANFVTLGAGPFRPGAAGSKVPSIYPSLPLDDEFTQYEELKVKTTDEMDSDMITSRDLSPGAFQVKDGLLAQGPIELDSVKHKLSSFWNNVKYGKTLAASELGLDARGSWCVRVCLKAGRRT